MLLQIICPGAAKYYDPICVVRFSNSTESSLLKWYKMPTVSHICGEQKYEKVCVCVGVYVLDECPTSHHVSE